MTLLLIIVSSAILLGGSFQFGYHTGVTNEPLELIKDFIRNASITRGFDFSNATADAVSTVAVAAFPVGGLIGGTIAGWMADKLGRKRAMMANMIPFIISSLLMGLCKVATSFEMLIIGRFLAGIPSGAVTGIAPMFLSEIAPPSFRGAMGTMNQLVIVFAILVAQVLGLESALGTAELWPYLLGFTLVTSTYSLICLVFCPESPKYLMLSKNDEIAARDVLYHLRGTIDVETEIAEMRKERESIGSLQTLSILQAFRIPYIRLPLLICIVMQLSQQLSGINAVINYSTSIFKDTANLQGNGPTYATLGIGGFNFLITAISVFLMDRAGRKTLHLTGLCLMAVFTLIITVAFNVRHLFPDGSTGQMVMVYIGVACVFLFVGGFALGPGAIPWFIVAEMFTQSSRGAAVTVCVVVNWTCQIAIAEGYPSLQLYLKDYSFLPFLILLAIFAVFTWWQVPETKGRSPEEMENLFKRRLNIEPGYQPMNLSDEDASSHLRVDASEMDP